MKTGLKSIFKNDNFLLGIVRRIKNQKLLTRYSIYDRLFSNVSGGQLSIQPKNIPGTFVVDARSDLAKRILIEKVYEPEITKLILTHLDTQKDAVNIGANIGLYANFLADQIESTKKVLAVEPTASAVELLEQNVQANNNQDKIICVHALCTKEEGSFEINVIPGNEEYASMGEIVHKSVHHKKYIKQPIKGYALDQLVGQYDVSPGILLIDVEGAELDVLQGAIKTLKKHHPVIIAEVDDQLLTAQQTNSTQLFEFLTSIDLSLTNLCEYSDDSDYLSELFLFERSDKFSLF